MYVMNILKNKTKNLSFYKDNYWYSAWMSFPLSNSKKTMSIITKPFWLLSLSDISLHEIFNDGLRFTKNCFMAWQCHFLPHINTISHPKLIFT